MENDTIYFGSDKYSIIKITEYNNEDKEKKDGKCRNKIKTERT